MCYLDCLVQRCGGSCGGSCGFGGSVAEWVRDRGVDHLRHSGRVKGDVGSDSFLSGNVRDPDFELRAERA